jgi:flavodoxin
MTGCGSAELPARGPLELAMPSRTLVAYYSMSGHTRQVADEIRDVTGADLEEISEPHQRRGVGGLMRALFDSVARRTPAITGASHDPADYDLLVLGGPVWAGRMAAPVRTYAKRYGTRATRVAFFCTEGSNGAETAFGDLQSLCEHPPEATLVVDAAHLPTVEHRAALDSFAASLSSVAH